MTDQSDQPDQPKRPRGRPRTTGSGAVAPVSFRLSAAYRLFLDRRGAAMVPPVSGDAVAQAMVREAIEEAMAAL